MGLVAVWTLQRGGGLPGRGLHSFPFPLNLSLLCLFPLS